MKDPFACRIHASKQGHFLLDHGKELFTNIRVLLAIYQQVREEEHRNATKNNNKYVSN